MHTLISRAMHTLISIDGAIHTLMGTCMITRLYVTVHSATPTYGMKKRSVP